MYPKSYLIKSMKKFGYYYIGIENGFIVFENRFYFRNMFDSWNEVSDFYDRMNKARKAKKWPN